ncbi:MAG: zinc-binding dehydrogenase [Leadbetterella sp.]|nr:zinc-binding dehydrogenase [Leadbetterella sp.]
MKHFGARVTAVCNTKNVSLLKSLGADNVIDYQTRDFTQTDERFHFIMDAVGKSSFGACKKLLTEKGIYVSTELGKNGANVFLALFTPLTGGKKVIFPIPGSKQEDVVFLKERIEKGDFRPVIDRYYTLEDVVDAYKYVETGQKTGNVVIKVA